METTPPQAAEAEEEEVDARALVQYARGAHGPVRANAAGADTQALQCYECERPVHLRRAHERRRGDKTYVVRAHFAHNRATGCGGGESPEHSAAKDLLARSHAFRFVHRCVGCAEGAVSVDVRNAEGRGVTEEPWQGLRLDVAYLDVYARVLGIVEVCKTHANSEEKEKALRASGLPWLEVDAQAVLDHPGGNTPPLEALSSSALRDSLCEACHAAAAAREEAKQRRIQEVLDGPRRRREEEAAEAAREALDQERTLETQRAERAEEAARKRARLGESEAENRALYPDVLPCFLRSPYNRHLYARLGRHVAVVCERSEHEWYLALDGRIRFERPGSLRPVLYESREAAQRAALVLMPSLACGKGQPQWEVLPPDRVAHTTRT
jgi:hypothetical protein